jgi:hypothetical protein
MRGMRTDRMYTAAVMSNIDMVCSAVRETMPKVSQKGCHDKVYQPNQKAYDE